MQITLAGRTALVTGGGRGIGRAISVALAEAGADVAVNYRRDADAARETVAAIRKLGRRAEAYGAPVEDYAEGEAMIGRIVADFGSLSILVNNAGIASRGNAVADTDPAELERVLRVHALAPHTLARLAIPHLRKHPRSDIVMISSVATRNLNARGAPYNMGKAAMEALAVTLAKEERQYGVRTNIVAPGLTDTEMGRRLAAARWGASDIRQLDADQPFGYVCTPEEVAAAVVYFCSEANPYANGQKLYIDGGGQ